MSKRVSSYTVSRKGIKDATCVCRPPEGGAIDHSLTIRILIFIFHSISEAFAFDDPQRAQLLTDGNYDTLATTDTGRGDGMAAFATSVEATGYSGALYVAGSPQSGGGNDVSMTVSLRPDGGPYDDPPPERPEPEAVQMEAENEVVTQQPTKAPISLRPTANPTAPPTKSPTSTGTSTDGKLIQEDKICSPSGEKSVECGAKPQDGRGETCCGGLICGGDRGKVCVENMEDSFSTTSSATSTASMAHVSVGFAFALSVGVVAVMFT